MADYSSFLQLVPGDRLLPDYLRGVREMFEGCVLEGCALSAGTGLTLDIASGKVYLGGFCVDYNGDEYTLPDDSTSYIYAELDRVDSNGKLVNYSFDFAAQASDSSTADYAMKVAEVVTASGSISSITPVAARCRTRAACSIEKSTGWHGSVERIKIMPTDFMSHDSGNHEYSQGAIVTVAGATSDLDACIPIPLGYKATTVRMYAATTKNVHVWEADIDTSAGTSVGTGDTSAEINITDVTADETNYLLIKVEDVDSANIYGGYVTIEKV